MIIMRETPEGQVVLHVGPSGIAQWLPSWQIIRTLKRAEVHGCNCGAAVERVLNEPAILVDFLESPTGPRFHACPLEASGAHEEGDQYTAQVSGLVWGKATKGREPEPAKRLREPVRPAELWEAYAE